MSNTGEVRQETRRALFEMLVRGELPLSALPAQDAPQASEAPGPVGHAVPLQSGGSRQPFFFLHGQWEDGKAFFCYPLARALGEDQPFYVLEPYSLEGLKAQPTFEAIAAAHLKALRAVQPEGPYLLGGWCNGGLVAYEMARQLQAEGQALALLVLMDAVTLDYPIHQWLFRHAISGFGKLIRLSGDIQFDVYLRLKQGLKHTFRLVRSSQYRKTPGSHVQTAKALHQDYPSIYDWIAMDYAPLDLCPGKISFFWSSEGNERNFRKGWRRVERRNEVEIYSMPGTHITCRTDHLQVLAEHLRTCLDKALPVAK
jgi:thioesterase domain-containing protein